MSRPRPFKSTTLFLIAGLLLPPGLPAQLPGGTIAGKAAETPLLEQAAGRPRTQAHSLWRERSASSPPETAQWTSIEELHKFYVSSFIATPGMGYGRVIQMVLHVDPKKRLLLSSFLDGTTKTDAWVVETLELIGIARHEQPVVFSGVARGTYADTRKLTPFEQRSLTELRSGKEIVSSKDGGNLLLVGAIRARADCLECHDDYKEGDLLGAFRYVLQRPPVDTNKP